MAEPEIEVDIKIYPVMIMIIVITVMFGVEIDIVPYFLVDIDIVITGGLSCIAVVVRPGGVCSGKWGCG